MHSARGSWPAIVKQLSEGEYKMYEYIFTKYRLKKAIKALPLGIGQLESQIPQFPCPETWWPVISTNVEHQGSPPVRSEPR